MNQSLIHIICDQLELENDLFQSVTSEEELLQQLAITISYLIEKRTEFLFQVLYRLDVNEQKIHKALSENDPPMQIAKLIIEREQEKLKSRERYKSDEKGDW